MGAAGTSARKEVRYLEWLKTFILSVMDLVVSTVLKYYINKWLDRKEEGSTA